MASTAACGYSVKAVNMPSILEVSAAGVDLDQVRELFREYERWAADRDIPVNLERELTELPQPYGPPGGWLLLAALGRIPAGCLAARRIDGRRCELKRLYVRPVFRGAGLGGILLKRSIERAREAGYEEILVETTPRMRRARMLYEAAGFVPCAPYQDEPTPGADCYLLEL